MGRIWFFHPGSIDNSWNRIIVFLQNGCVVVGTAILSKGILRVGFVVVVVVIRGSIGRYISRASRIGRSRLLSKRVLWVWRIIVVITTAGIVAIILGDGDSQVILLEVVIVCVNGS